MKSRVLAIARRLVFLTLVPGALLVAAGEHVTLKVQADKPGPRVNPAMWGVFFEDVNLGADGGLYAELVKNRSFEFPDGMMRWFEVSPTTAILSVVNVSTEPRETTIKLSGVSRLAKTASLSLLTSASQDDVNTLEEPAKVAPVTQSIEVAGPNVTCVFPANSLSVIRLKVEKRPAIDSSQSHQPGTNDGIDSRLTPEVTLTG
jgi:hypothetical protein